MARDAQGNDLGAIDVQLTGFAAINFNATTAPSLAELAGNSIPTGYEYLGLFLEDGGYAEESEAGDLTYFFQQGYSLRTGEQSITGKLVPAEDNDVVWKLTGIDSNVRKDIAYDGSFGLIIATQFKNGNIVARGGMAHVTEVAPSAESRGEINSIEITFEWEYSTEYEGYYRIVRGGAALTQAVQPLTDTEAWTLRNGATITKGVLKLLDNAQNNDATTTTITPVAEGDTILYSYEARKVGTTVTSKLGLTLQSVKEDGTYISNIWVKQSSTDYPAQFAEFSGVTTIPANVEFIQPRIACVKVGDTTSTGFYEVRNVSIQKIG